MTRLRVAHLVDRYLRYSTPWIHQQIVGCPDVDPHVVAFQRIRDGADRFPVPSLTVLREAAPLRYRITRLTPWQWRLAASIASADLRSHAPAIAHGHFGDTAWQYIPVIRSLQIPFVTSFYGRDMSLLPARSPRWRTRYAELFAIADAVFCEGPHMARALSALGCPPHKVHVQRLGVNPARFAQHDRRPNPGEPLRVLTVARFVEKKGVPDAIAAVARAAQHVPVTLTIVGDADPSAPREAARIQSAVEQHKASDIVSFAGRLEYEQFANAQRDFHVVLQPSRCSADGDTEGGAPVALIECAGAGLPAVATRHADVPEVVLHGKTGLLAEEGDIATLVEHLVCLARNPNAVTEMGRAAAAHVRARFDAATCLLALREKYERVVQESVRNGR